MSNTVRQLDSYFTQLVSSLMSIERQPLTRLTEARDAVNVRRGAFQDLSGKLQSLQSLLKPFKAGSANTVMDARQAGSLSNVTAGYTVLSTAVSNSAIAGAYDIHVDTLAREQRVRSDRQSYSDQALGLAGQISVGGAATRSQSTGATLADTVTGFGVAALAAGQTELGSGGYYVETRNDATSGWQFRLVDSTGKAISVKQGSGATFSSAWQALPASGEYDTGRGLTVSFGTDSNLFQAAGRDNGAAQTAYTAQGAAITVSAGQSLASLATAINSATYADGNGVTATIVDRQLVLAAKDSGTAHALALSDASGSVLRSLGVLTAGGGVKNSVQAAADASFTVNGVTVTRSKNSGIDDVISGVTLNFAADAEGRSATLTVKSDTGPARSAIKAFLDKFNEVQTYLQAKTDVSVTVDGDTRTYTRGTLSSDTVFSELRMDLFSGFASSAGNAGTLKSLREIGLAVDDNLNATVVDDAKLEAALSGDLPNTALLLDKVVTGLDTLLSRFTTSGTGYLASATKSLDTEIADANSEITDLNKTLDTRQENLLDEYGALQAQLLELTYMQQQWSSIYGTYR